jgi:hypothetical protein
MNERVKQLALQALKHPDNDNDGLTVFDNAELEKFAELIVRECADVANQHMEHNEGTDYNVGGKIKQHFGVEE